MRGIVGGMFFSSWAWGVGDRGLVTSHPHSYLCNLHMVDTEEVGAQCPFAKGTLRIRSFRPEDVKDDVCCATCFHRLPKIWISDKLDSLFFLPASLVAYILGS